MFDVQRWIHTFFTSLCHIIFFISFGIIDIISIIIININKELICLNTKIIGITPYNYLLIGNIISIILIILIFIYNIIFKKQISQIKEYNSSIQSISKSFRATKTVLTKSEQFIIVKYIRYLSTFGTIITLYCIAWSIFGFIIYGELGNECKNDEITILILVYSIIKLISGIVRFCGQCANDMVTCCGFDTPPSRVSEGPWSTFYMTKDYKKPDKAYE